MSIRVDADAGRCVGAGQCVLSAPAVFDQDENGTVVVLDDQPTGEHDESVREAAYLCPASTITLTVDS